MPPESTLTNPNPPPKSLPAPRHPMTTAGKVAKAKARIEALSKNIPREAPPDTRKPKPRSYPSPDEVPIPPKQSSTIKSKSSWSSKKPLTTAGKVAAAEAKKRAMGGPKSGQLAKKTKREKPPGVVTLLNAQAASSINLKASVAEVSSVNTAPYKRKEGVLGVLYRRTERAEQWRKDNPSLFASAKGTVGGAIPKEAGSKSAGVVSETEQTTAASGNIIQPKACHLLRLPEELRREVWRHVVVEDRLFIWPDSRTGREQPDLALTCRQIREETLRLFYGENTFAVDVSARSFPKKQRTAYSKTDEKLLQGPKAVSEWARVLERTGRLKMVRKWAFFFAPPGCWSTGSTEDMEDRSFVVSVVVTKRHLKAESIIMEVHQDARCIMPGFMAMCGRCEVKECPDWLYYFIEKVMVDSQEKVVNRHLVAALAEGVKDRAFELLAVRCQRSDQGDAV